MVAVAFDTLKYAEQLKKSGMPAEQAEAQARALADVLQINLGDFAAKQDIKELELRMDSRFERVQGELTLVKWMLGILLAGVASLVLKAFFQ
jgi:hypothetical protein